MREESRSQRAGTRGSAAIGLAVLIIAAVMMTAGCDMVDPSGQRGEDVERKMELFPWASPECVAQEIGNVGYGRNTVNLRTCMTENRVAELESRVAELEARLDQED